MRSALTAAGVAGGVALVIAIRIVNASTLRAFTDAIEDLSGTAALQVRGPGTFSEEVADRIRAVPGVHHAVPILTATFFTVDPPGAGEALAVFAADLTDGHAVRTLRLVEAAGRVVDDPLEFLADPRSIVVTDVLAARRGVGRGDTVRLRTPNGIQTFAVRGVLPAGGIGRAFGGSLVLMDVIGAQTVLGREGQIDQVDVTLREGTAVEDAARHIDAVLGDGLETVRPARRGEQIERYLGSFRTLLSGLSGLALLAAVFIVGSAVGTSVAARRHEIGLLRCVGAERRHLARLFVGEAVLMGGAGAAAGVPLGILLARVLVHHVSESVELVFSLRTFAKGLTVTPATLSVGIVSGLGAALAAGWLPARQALLVSPVVAARPSAPPTVARRWPAPGAIAAALALTAAGLWTEVRLHWAWGGNVAALAADFALVSLFMRHAGCAAAVVLGPARSRLAVAEQLAIDRLVRIPDHLALAAGVLALGLGLMLMAGTLTRSFEASVLDFIRHQVRADLVVASTATTGWIESPLPEAVGARIGAVPGVGSVERVRLAEHVYAGSRISIDSLDASAFAAGRVEDFVFAAGDPLRALAAVRGGTGVLVSRNFARQFGATLGTVLDVATPAGPLRVPVAGVVVDYVSPRGSIIMARDTFVRWWGDRTVNRFHVSVAEGHDVEAVRQAIATGVGAELALKVLTQRQLYAYHVDAVRRAFRFTLALEVLPLVVASLGLAEALLAVSFDRRREFALLRAAGATRAQVARTVVAEAAGVGVLGLVGGIGMGLMLAVLWVRVNFTQQIGWDLDFHFATASLGPAVLAAFLASVPAGLVPAWHVANRPVVEALRDA